LRIIGGKHRSRKLLSPPEQAATRPIPDRVKLALFNMLRGHTEGAAVIDLFAGTGALGLEAVSRGATRALFVERDRRMAKVLQENITRLGEGGAAEVAIGDALGPAPIARCPRPLKLAFVDPPYPMTLDPNDWPRIIDQCAKLIELMRPDGYLVLRTPWPFVRRPPRPEAEAGPHVERRRGRTDARDPFADWDDDHTDEADLDDDWETDDAAATEDADDSGAAASAPAERPVDISLAIPGADGPETHVYRHTAVHLYAPRRAEAKPVDADGPAS